MKRSESLKTIENQFINVMNEMGIEGDKQKTLINLSIEKKIQILVNMKSDSQKEQMLLEYIENLNNQVTKCTIIGLLTILPFGYSIFKERGLKILHKKLLEESDISLLIPLVNVVLKNQNLQFEIENIIELVFKKVKKYDYEFFEFLRILSNQFIPQLIDNLSSINTSTTIDITKSTPNNSSKIENSSRLENSSTKDKLNDSLISKILDHIITLPIINNELCFFRKTLLENIQIKILLLSKDFINKISNKTISRESKPFLDILKNENINVDVKNIYKEINEVIQEIDENQNINEERKVNKEELCVEMKKLNITETKIEEFKKGDEETREKEINEKEVDLNKEKEFKNKDEETKEKEFKNKDEETKEKEFKKGDKETKEKEINEKGVDLNNRIINFQETLKTQKIQNMIILESLMNCNCEVNNFLENIKIGIQNIINMEIERLRMNIEKMRVSFIKEEKKIDIKSVDEKNENNNNKPEIRESENKNNEKNTQNKKIETEKKFENEKKIANTTKQSTNTTKQSTNTIKQSPSTETPRKIKKMPFKKKTTIQLYDKEFITLRWKKIEPIGKIWKNISWESCHSSFTLTDFLPFVKSSTPQSITSKILVKTIFPPKKGNGIAIALGRIKIPDTELINSILRFESKHLDENIILQLIKNYPTNDEFEQIKLLINNNSTIILGRAEEFYKNCINFSDQLLIALKFLKFSITFSTIKKELLRKIEILEIQIIRILECNELSNLLKTCLYIGNVLNSKNYLGKANAFSLDSINSFSNIKGKENKSLISLIKSKVDTKKIQNSLIDIEICNSINFNFLIQEKENLINEFKDLINFNELENPLKFYSKDIKNIEFKFQNLEKIFKNFCEYFGCEMNEKIFIDFLELKNLIQNE